MLILLGLLVCCAVTFTVLQARKQNAHKAIATVAAGCAVVLSTAFLFYFVVLIKPDPVLNAIHTDITSAMVVGSVAMAATAFICGCTALVCLLRRIEGWVSVFLLLAVSCAWQGGTMFFLLFLH
jgi:hypothetical protein